jgi:hypothetical protein
MTIILFNHNKKIAMKKILMMSVLLSAGTAALAQTYDTYGRGKLVSIGTGGAVATPPPPTARACASCGADKVIPGLAVLRYTIDEQELYQVSNATPGTDVELYSTPSGGRLVASATANGEGVAVFTITKGAKVAFAINHTRRNEKGVAGTGQMSTIPEVSIRLKDFNATVQGDKPSLSWKAQTTGNGYSFEIQKSDDNKTFTKAGKLSATYSRTMSSYSFNEGELKNDVAWFRIKITGSNGVSIYSQARKVQKSANVKIAVFPTVFSSSFQVTTDAAALPAEYTIFDANGKQVVLSGKLNNAVETVNTNFAPGTYIIKVRGRNNQEMTQKLIKE